MTENVTNNVKVKVRKEIVESNNVISIILNRDRNRAVLTYVISYILAHVYFEMSDNSIETKHGILI